MNVSHKAYYLFSYYRYGKVYNKKSKKWSLSTEKVEMDYSYIAGQRSRSTELTKHSSYTAWPVCLPWKHLFHVNTMLKMYRYLCNNKGLYQLCCNFSVITYFCCGGEKMYSFFCRNTKMKSIHHFQIFIKNNINNKRQNLNISQKYK